MLTGLLGLGGQAPIRDTSVAYLHESYSYSMFYDCYDNLERRTWDVSNKQPPC